MGTPRSQPPHPPPHTPPQRARNGGIHVPPATNLLPTYECPAPCGFLWNGALGRFSMTGLLPDPENGPQAGGVPGWSCVLVCRAPEQRQVLSGG
eukprot:scaffold13602_cov131-Isochrysis_galbana.AAC.5